MPSYHISTIARREEIESVPKALISHFRAGTPGVEPKATAAVAYLDGEGLLCRMECYETDPKAVVTEFNGDTYKDSCLEFFINCAPECGDYYLNLEGNAIGTLHCKYGKDRYERRALPEDVTLPSASAEVYSDHWAIEYFLPLATIQAVFGKDALKKGDVLKGNFYKCGDETAAPHYGMWSPVTQEKLDFHVPAFFGELLID